MVSLDPSAAIASCERALRHLLRSAIEHSERLTLAEWAGQQRVSDWQERSDVEAKKRQSRGVAVTSTDLLDYSNLFDLIAMCQKEWNAVSPALGKSKEVLAILRRLDDVRNTIAHGRELVPFEVDLVAGIAGDIRNRVTIYMSSQDPAGGYYPRIESVSDEFGNVADGAGTLNLLGLGVQTGLTLRVGDRVRFTCHGTDPQGRTLRWRLRHTPDSQSLVVVEGADAELEWQVTPKAVGEHSATLIRLEGDSDYHRYEGEHDGQVIFWYRVLPPH